MDGSVVLSLDTELAWGYHGSDGDRCLDPDGARERDVIDELLRLFEEYEAPATWAIVGHLFLTDCDGVHGEMVRPEYPDLGGDWYGTDPGTDAADAPLRYAPDVVERIVESSVAHEVGTHTFSHVVCGREGCTPDVLRSELRACKAVASEYGCDLSSMVFPKNSIDHLSVLADEGIDAYRGRSPEMTGWRDSLAGGMMRYARYALHRPPPLVAPVEVLDGVWNLPASRFLSYPYRDSPVHDLSNRLPTRPRVVQAKRAIRRAKRDGGILHLWGHPHEFTPALLSDLELILAFAREESVPVRTMRDVVRDRASRATDTERRPELPRPTPDADG